MLDILNISEMQFHLATLAAIFVLGRALLPELARQVWSN